MRHDSKRTRRDVVVRMSKRIVERERDCAERKKNKRDVGVRRKRIGASNRRWKRDFKNKKKKKDDAEKNGKTESKRRRKPGVRNKRNKRNVGRKRETAVREWLEKGERERRKSNNDVKMNDFGNNKKQTGEDRLRHLKERNDTRHNRRRRRRGRGQRRNGVEDRSRKWKESSGWLTKKRMRISLEIQHRPEEEEEEQEQAGRK